MLGDRSYMRQDTWQPTPYRSGWLILIFLNAGCFLIQQSLIRFRIFPEFNHYFGLSVPGIQDFYLWQFFTFQFLHSGLGHLFFNCLTIFFLGRALEQEIGRRRFFTIYFAAGLLGGLIQFLGMYLFPNYFDLQSMRVSAVVMGASAGVAGIVSTFALMAPNRPISLLLIPVSFPVKVLFWIEFALIIYGIVFEPTRLAHLAHLGGLVCGVLYIRSDKFSSFLDRVSEFRLPERPVRKKLAIEEKLEQQSTESIIKEVDIILDKISAKGLHSLTDRERKILEVARNKMPK